MEEKTVEKKLELCLEKEQHLLREVLSLLLLEENALLATDMNAFSAHLEKRKKLQKSLSNLKKKRRLLLGNHTAKESRTYLTLPDFIDNCTLKIRESTLCSLHEKIQLQKKSSRKLAKLALRGVKFLPGITQEPMKASIQLATIEKIELQA